MRGRPHPSIVAPVLRETVGDIMTRSDDAIRQNLEAELRDRPWVPGRSFRFEVKDGIVELHGFVWDERQRAALRVAAENIAGVKEVRDHMTIADIALRA